MIAVPDPRCVRDAVARALAEDLGTGDVSAELVDAGTRARARILVREDAVLCGRPWAQAVFAELGDVTLEWQHADGDALQAGDTVCRLAGDARALLSGERTALNFLQTLSGTATLARRHVQAVAGSGCTVLDTRKTLPGLRAAQKYAVRCGGASNHRAGLFDAFLIKENHIAAAGGIGTAVARARSLHPELLLEVEAETLAQMEEAIAAGADRVLLDNFDLEQLAQAVALNAGRITLEASGGIDLAELPAVARSGVDFVSIGQLTKDVRAIDFSMRFELSARHA